MTEHLPIGCQDDQDDERDEIETKQSVRIVPEMQLLGFRCLTDSVLF